MLQRCRLRERVGQLFWCCVIHLDLAVVAQVVLSDAVQTTVELLPPVARMTFHQSKLASSHTSAGVPLKPAQRDSSGQMVPFPGQ